MSLIGNALRFQDVAEHFSRQAMRCPASRPGAQQRAARRDPVAMARQYPEDLQLTASQTFTARRLAAAALSAAALVGAGSPAAANGAEPRGPQVEISKVQYDAPGHGSRSNRSLNEEWVQITNSGRESVNLDDWTLSNRQGRVYTYHHLA